MTKFQQHMRAMAGAYRRCYYPVTAVGQPDWPMRGTRGPLQGNQNEDQSKSDILEWITRCVLCYLLFLAGCGSRGPFDVVPVSGKVVYRDGSPIMSDRIVVRFVPQGVSAAGKVAPGAATGEVNVSDGIFPGLTTYKHFDGAIVGRHKVLVMAFKTGLGGINQPIVSVPAKYAKVDTTPLEVEVSRGGGPYILSIDR